MPFPLLFKNATILHYENNNQDLKSGELLLIDTGARWGIITQILQEQFPSVVNNTEKQKFYYNLLIKAI